MKSFSWKSLQSKLSNMNRTDWLIVLLFGILLLVIAIPSNGGEQEKSSYPAQEKTEQTVERVAENEKAEENDAYKEMLEKELEELLSDMDGVGKVRVMLTMKDTGAHVLDKNIKRNGEDSETSTVVYKNDKEESPYVTNWYLPDVEGVLIVAQGGGNAVTVSDISDAVMALFNIEAHKIKIVKMSD